MYDSASNRGFPQRLDLGGEVFFLVREFRLCLGGEPVEDRQKEAIEKKFRVSELPADMAHRRQRKLCGEFVENYGGKSLVFF